MRPRQAVLAVACCLVVFTLLSWTQESKPGRSLSERQWVPSQGNGGEQPVFAVSPSESKPAVPLHVDKGTPEPSRRRGQNEAGQGSAREKEKASEGWTHEETATGTERPSAQLPREWQDAFANQGDQLVYKQPIGTLHEGGIFFPSEVKRVWIDVGAHKKAMYTYTSLMNNDDLGLVAFEPQLAQWGYLQQYGHDDRMVAFPAAVSNTQKPFVTFRIAGTDMCSSILDVDTKANRSDWPGGCTETLTEFPVPVVRLETLIPMLPVKSVEFLKVDAQGGDFDVLLSAGERIVDIETVAVEVQTGRNLYAGAKSAEEYIDYMTRFGFELVKRQLQGPYEENLLFHNKRFAPLEQRHWSADDITSLPLDKIFDGAYLKRLERKKAMRPPSGYVPPGGTVAPGRPTYNSNAGERAQMDMLDRRRIYLGVQLSALHHAISMVAMACEKKEEFEAMEDKFVKMWAILKEEAPAFSDDTKAVLEAELVRTEGWALRQRPAGNDDEDQDGGGEDEAAGDKKGGGEEEAR